MHRKKSGRKKQVGELQLIWKRLCRIYRSLLDTGYVFRTFLIISDFILVFLFLFAFFEVKVFYNAWKFRVNSLKYKRPETIPVIYRLKTVTGSVFEWILFKPLYYLQRSSHWLVYLMAKFLYVWIFLLYLIFWLFLRFLYYKHLWVFSPIGYRKRKVQTNEKIRPRQRRRRRKYHRGYYITYWQIFKRVIAYVKKLIFGE